MRRLVFLLALVGGVAVAQPPKPLRTVGEETDFAKTSTSADVRAFCGELAKRSPLVTATTFGTTAKGTPLPLLILADPPVRTAEEAAKSGKPTVLVFANIHAGEVDGKEAVLALARDLTAAKDNPILKNLIVLIAPNFNPDGNDAFGDKNRPGQNGPAMTGKRTNSDGFDLNRDFTKLESNETRALLKLVNAWNPLAIVDCHTTNGSYHRYTLTYDGPRHPCGGELVPFSRNKLLPAVAAKVKAATGFDTFPYGDFDRAHAKWVTYPCQPRYGIQSFALRGTFGILSESYSYASFADRVKASYAFVKANLEYVAENRAAVAKVVADARKPRDRVALRVKTVARAKPETVLGWVEENGKKTDAKKDYECAILDDVEATAEATVPAAYLIPAEYAAAVDTLQRHGIQVEELREQCEVTGERYTVTGLTRAAREYQKHKNVTLEVKPEPATVRVEAGSFRVRTRQPLGTLAAYLLEPLAEDGLAAWNFFDAGLKVGQPFPVLRVTTEQPLFTGAPKPLPEDRVTPRKFSEADLSAGRGGPGGAGLGDITWLPDGEHWLQSKDGKLWQVHARTGKATVFVDAAKLRQSLSKLTGLNAKQSARWVNGPRYNFDPARTGVLIDSGAGLVFAKRDGSPAVRLTKEKVHEFPTFSPDGARVAFVRDGNLFAVSMKDGVTKQLTPDGGKNDILNGRADWVYEEEIFSRNGRAFWWSPDGKRLAFLRFDDSMVPKFPITDTRPTRGKLETISYPKPGDPNPHVKLGVVPADGTASPTFLDLNGAKADDTLIARVGWVPGEKPVPFAYVQNRVQTKLDFVTWPAGKPTVLFAEKSPAWVEDLGEPTFLRDGSFLILSERTGWKHIYRYAADGKLIGPVTDGKWEVKAIERVDQASGDVYFTAAKVRPTATHLCLVTLGDPAVQVISPEEPTHRVEMAPTGPMYVDRFGDDRTPTRTVLRELYTKVVRVLDTNPMYRRDRHVYGMYERAKIKTPDGFEMEAAITYPPDFHEYNRYPVWVLTYAGPHAPTIRDGWSSRAFEQVLAASGVVVLRVDPRAASGKGVESAWTSYKKLGVQELKDLETAVDWICQNKWADPTRVGLSGHSFGGYITAYALTHSKKFSAGIAGAPVTDWRLYDSIYTERYMGLPADNKENYDATSVVKAAKNLHGKLLIIHGMIDDNVHAQNSLQLIDALQKADKEFEVMVYPSFRHPITTSHYPKTQLRFIRKVFGLTG